MEKRRTAIVLVPTFAFLLLAVQQSVAATSSPTRLISQPSTSLFWHTYFDGTSPIVWEWPAQALSARLTVKGKAGISVHVLDRTTSSFTPTPPESASDEDVLDLTLEFFASPDASGDPLENETLESRGLGIVRGTNGATTDLRRSDVSSRRWSKVRGTSVVLPLPEGNVSLTCDGTPQAIAAAPGWFLDAPFVADTVWSLEVDSMPCATCKLTGVPGALLFIK